jgi:hypothetical protein
MCPNCASRVHAGAWQTPYGCAPYVAHCLAAGKFVDAPLCGSLDDFGGISYQDTTYDLNYVSSRDPNAGGAPALTDYLLASGWTKTQTVKAGTVCAVVGANGNGPCDFCHVVIGVGDNVCNAHDMAEYHVSCDQYQKNLCLDPPS